MRGGGSCGLQINLSGAAQLIATTANWLYFKRLRVVAMIVKLGIPPAVSALQEPCRFQFVPIDSLQHLSARLFRNCFPRRVATKAEIMALPIRLGWAHRAALRAALHLREVLSWSL